jgi:hypothetical protein
MSAEPEKTAPPTAGEAQVTLVPLPGETYMEGPYMVFTAAYHLRRGYCCNSDCRHCPYR